MTLGYLPAESTKSFMEKEASLRTRLFDFPPISVTLVFVSDDTV
jgi:hypothetical protein